MLMNPDIYDRLGVKKLINAAGTYTIVGGSRMSQTTLEAMQSAARSFVDVRTLQEKVHERLAEITNNESALVVTGAAAGLYILAASCVSIKHGRPFVYVSPEDVRQCEIVVHRAHRNPYDWALRQLGVKLVEIGYPNMIQPTSSKDLEQAINDNTVAVFHTEVKHGWVPGGALDLESTLRIAHTRDIPVVIDGAAQLPPVANLWQFNKMGASATVFSGGKDLSGPQASGLITGRARLLDVARETYFPNYGIGRMLKVGREEMVGLLLAVEQYVSMDHEARRQWCEEQIDLIKQTFTDYRDVRVYRSYPNEAGQPIPRAVISFTKTGISGGEIAERLRSGNPGIFVRQAGDNGIFVNPMTLQAGEMEVVIGRLQDVFRESGIS
jgi:D-glucosaminate-6-phosphate ammonia-lyase